MLVGRVESQFLDALEDLCLVYVDRGVMIGTTQEVAAIKHKHNFLSKCSLNEMFFKDSASFTSFPP